MNEITRTLAFVVVAAVAIAAATVTHFATQPKPLAEFEAVGTEFYKEFTDPLDAKALKVIAYDEDTATVKEFSVQFKDGRWRIPSHHDYPADAEDRLYETATSVVGIERGAMAGRRPSSHEKLGVIDPTDENVASLKGRGQRITLTRQDGSPLADYIIGKKVEGDGPGEGGRYYVRAPGENEVYITELDIDLSTKFSDWIESDLLKLSSFDLVGITVDKYSIDENRGTIIGRETSELSRKTSSDDWKLAGLDEEKEEVDEDNVREIANGVDNLKIVGVRPKPGGLKPDLSFDPKFVRNELEFRLLQGQLAAKGFFLGPDPDDKDKRHLYSDEGELIAATKDGVVYNLRFGKIFTGSEFEIEVGFASDDADEKDSDKKKEKEDAGEGKKEGKKGSDDTEEKGKKDGESEDEKSASDSDDGEEEGEKKDDLKKNRYLFVTASFDEKYLADKPQKPVEPTKPAGPPKAEESKKDDTGKKEKTGDAAGKKAGKDDAKSSKSPGDAPSGGDDGGEEPQPDAAKGEQSDPGEKKEDADKKDPQAEYEAAKKKYDEDLRKYEDDLKDFDKKVEEGKKTVKELNDRFAAWYYVISAESFENLRLARKDLVKPKEKKEEDEKKESDEGEKKPEPKEKPATPGPSHTEKKPEPKEKPAAEKKPEPKKKSAPKKKPEPKEKSAAKKKPEPKKQPAAEKQPDAKKEPDSPEPKTKKKADPS